MLIILISIIGLIVLGSIAVILLSGSKVEKELKDEGFYD